MWRLGYKIENDGNYVNRNDDEDDDDEILDIIESITRNIRN